MLFAARYDQHNPDSFETIAELTTTMNQDGEREGVLANLGDWD